MAKKANNTEEKIVAVEEVLSKSEQFIEKNQKIIIIVIGAIVVVVLGIFAFKKYYIAPKEAEAQGQMFAAQQYFEKDSITKAINGDGNFLGFEAIADEYSMTNAANLAHYYLGICYLRKGEYEKAIDNLESFKGSDRVIKPLSLSAIGDAYMELGDKEKAVKYYLKAANKSKNLFTSPQFLMKAGLTYEMLGDWENALKTYEKLRKDFYKSNEARQVDKYIAKAKGMLKNK
jgi:tetratricopeptide (TPR) repeat protein